MIAGHVVRDERLDHLYGRLLYTDNGNDEIRSLVPFPGGAFDDRSTGIEMPGEGRPFSFAEGFHSRLFVLSGAGAVYRLDPR